MTPTARSSRRSSHCTCPPATTASCSSTTCCVSTRPAQTLFRYQYGDHLQSVGIELDGAAQLISYEEFHPYGTTAYRLTSSAVEAPAKRYRYTGMERDEESGLALHGERYLLLSLARWTRADAETGGNRYAYARNNPRSLVDVDGRREQTTEERARIAFLHGLMDQEVQAWSRAGTVWKAVDALLPGGRTGRYNTAAAHVREYAAAIRRAAPGEEVHGWEPQSGGTFYHDPEGQLVAQLQGVPVYRTAREVAVAKEDAVFQAGITSPLAALGYVVADAAGASEETKANVAATGAWAWQGVSAAGWTATASNAHNVVNQSYNLAPTPDVVQRPTLPKVVRPPAIEVLEAQTGGRAYKSDVQGGLNWEPTVVFPGEKLFALGVAAKEGTPVKWGAEPRSEYIVTNQLVLDWYALVRPARDPSGAPTQGPPNLVMTMESGAWTGVSGPVPFYLFSASPQQAVPAATSQVATQPGVGIPSPLATQSFTTAPGGFGPAVREGGARYIVKGPLP